MDRKKNKTKKYVLLAIMLLIALFVFWVVDAEHSLTGKPSVDMILLLAVIFLGFYVWVRTTSDWSERRQLEMIVLACLVVAGLFASIQMDGLYGNGRPVFTWRWQPTTADQYQSRATPHSGSPKNISFPDFESVNSADWPQFRGANRDGIATQSIQPWEIFPRERWRIPIGAGWSSFAAVGGYGFTQEQRGKHEVTACYELATGIEVWNHTDIERFSEITSGEGPRATPTFDDGRIYSLGATGILNCLNARTGEKIWTVNVLVENDGDNCLFGLTGSPLIADDKVIVAPGATGASLAAYDKLSGSLIWKSGDAQASYSSPILATFDGVRQVLIFNGEGLFSHELASGEILWSQAWVSNEDEKNNVCQPIVIGTDRVFISSGYGEGSALFQISSNEGDFLVKQIWRNNKLKSKFASAVFDGEFVFGLDEGILVCIDPMTGQRKWKSGRYGHGQLLLAGKYLLVQAEKGYVAQVEASPNGFREIAQLPALDDRTWNHPILTGNRLIVRNDREAICFEVQ